MQPLATSNAFGQTGSKPVRILVAGRSGQVARSLADLSSQETPIRAVGRPDLDIVDPASIDAAIAAHAPDVVVNAAAYTAVDRAESEPEAAFAANRDGARHLAAGAARAGVPIVHISTDYVFSGDKDAPYVEDDPTGPRSVYGHSKLAGEAAVAAANPAHVILRTAWVYSPHGHNFARTMLRLAGERDTVRVVADQRGTPTYAPDIAASIVHVCRALALDGDAARRFGVFHMTGREATSWAGFAEAIFAASAARGGPTAHVEHIGTADYPTPAARPRNSVLDTVRFRETFECDVFDRSSIATSLGALMQDLAKPG